MSSQTTMTTYYKSLSGKHYKFKGVEGWVLLNGMFIALDSPFTELQNLRSMGSTKLNSKEIDNLLK